MTDLRRLAELNREGPEDSGKRDFLGYLVGGAALAVGIGVAGFFADVGGIKTKAIKSLEASVEDSHKQYDPISVDGSKYVVVRDDVYLLGSVTPQDKECRIKLRQNMKPKIGIIEDWKSFDDAVKHINGGKEPKAHMPYDFPIERVEQGTSLYQRVIDAHEGKDKVLRLDTSIQSNAA